eukprot:7935317-Pyramimonas_sp.AAC.1
MDVRATGRWGSKQWARLGGGSGDGRVHEKCPDAANLSRHDVLGRSIRSSRCPDVSPRDDVPMS